MYLRDLVYLLIVKKKKKRIPCCLKHRMSNLAAFYLSRHIVIPDFCVKVHNVVIKNMHSEVNKSKYVSQVTTFLPMEFRHNLRPASLVS